MKRAEGVPFVSRRLFASTPLLVVPALFTRHVGAQSAVPDPNAFLVNMHITLITTHEDKDKDTRLEIWINKLGEREAAYRDIGREHEFDNGSHDEFDVQPKSHPMTRSEILGSWVQLRIDPKRVRGVNGNDTWRFNFDVVLRFSDGTTFSQKFNDCALSQEVKTGIYHLKP